MTTVNRAYRFRLYPTEAQSAELSEWERQLRRLWNLAHEQRLASLSRWRDRGRYGKGQCPSCGAAAGAKHTAACARVDYYRQGREMTELLSVDDQLARVVCSARQETLRHLERAWQRFFKRLGGRPRFKNRHDSVGIYFSTPKSWRADNGVLTLAGVASSVGPIKIRQDRPWPGDAKFSSCHIVRDVDEWYAVFPLEFTLQVDKPKAGAVGINRGAIHAIADSMGRVVDSPKYYDAAMARIALLSRRLQRKEKGSRNRYKASQRLARCHQKVRRQREWFLHDHSAYYTAHYATIGIEDWSTKKIVESSKADEAVNWTNRCKRHGCEGKIVKRRLCQEHFDEVRFIPRRAVHRSILDVGWYEFGRQLEYKAQGRGGRIIKVNPGPEPTASFLDGTAGETGISATCSDCGAPLAERASGLQESSCEACMARRAGDVNAARNVLLRALRAAPVAPKTPKASIKIKGRAKAQTETTGKPPVEACGGEAPVGAPVEAGRLPREEGHPERTVLPKRTRKRAEKRDGPSRHAPAEEVD